MSYEAFIATVETWSLKASFPYEVNDPLENVIQKNKHLPPEILKDSSFGYICPFFSFSRNMSSSAMWGQYADWGRGICLVFAFPIRNDSIEWIAGETPGIFNPLICNKEQAVPLLYQDDRFKINYNAKSKRVKSDIYVMNRWLQNCIIVKGKHWEYESEVRIHTCYESATHENKGVLSFEWPMRYLIGAITGPKCKRDRHYIEQKIRLCKSAFQTKKTDIKLFNNTLVAQAKPHDVKFEFVAPPFFDKVDSLLFRKLVLDDSLFGLHYTSTGYEKKWNEWTKTVYKKELKIINAYINKIKTLIIEELSSHPFHDTVIDSFVYYLTHTVMFKNEEIIQDEKKLRERIRSYLTSNMVSACNDLTDNSIKISKIADSLSNLTFNKISQLVFEMHEKRSIVIIKEIKKNDKSV